MERERAVSAQDVQAELADVERDVTLRRLLWEARAEWERLARDWTETRFDQLDVQQVQKHVHRFTQTVYMLEKGASGEQYVCAQMWPVTDLTESTDVFVQVFSFLSQKRD